MLMGRGGNEARPVVGCSQGSTGKKQHQEELSGSSPQPALSARVFIGKFTVAQELFKEI